MEDSNSRKLQVTSLIMALKNYENNLVQISEAISDEVMTEHLKEVCLNVNLLNIDKARIESALFDSESANIV